MAKTIKENSVYFILLGIFVVLGGIYLGQSDKTSAIFFFSDNRSAQLDQAFRFITKLGEGPMYFLIGGLALAIRMRYSLMVALTGLSVLGLSYWLKALFAIDRPAAFFAKQNLTAKLNFVEGVDLHTAATSFPSGHAMSAFALYGLLVLILPSKKRFAIPLFALAFLVAVSRIYLVQHFWPDVYAGAIIGSMLAVFYYFLLGKHSENAESWLERPLLDFRRKWV